MKGFNARDFFDESDYEGVGEREADTFHALKCIEEALNILACCGKSKGMGEVAELLNRAYQLVDRHYGADELAYTVELQFDENYIPGNWNDDEKEDE